MDIYGRSHLKGDNLQSSPEVIIRAVKPPQTLNVAPLKVIQNNAVLVL